jgi:hypothetical protein
VDRAFWSTQSTLLVYLSMPRRVAMRSGLSMHRLRRSCRPPLPGLRVGTFVDLGRRDHRRAHQRHVDGGEADALVGELAGAQRVQASSAALLAT